jgi:hypothetical protein
MHINPCITYPQVTEPLSSSASTPLIPWKTPRCLNVPSLENVNLEIRHQTEKSAQLVFQVENPFAERSGSEIYRLHLNDEGARSKESGFFIGSRTSKVYCGIIDVNPEDLIVLRIANSRTFCDLQISFQVSADFSVICVHPSLTADAEEGLWPEIQSRGTKQFQSLDVREFRFREFIGSPHTGWIQTVVDAQVQEWKTRSVQDLIRYAPDQLTAEQIHLETRLQPELCLIYLCDRLSAEQKNYCLIAAPEAAVTHALDLMNTSHLKNAIEKCPDVLLQHAISNLNERNLRACALAAPGAAFEMRTKVSPPIHALLLSYTIDILGELWDETPFEELQNEVAKSFNDFPEVWIETYDGNRNRLLASLQVFLELDFGIKNHPPLEIGLVH